METQHALDIAIKALQSFKAKEIVKINVSHLTQMMSYMVVCTATSVTHTQALASNLRRKAKIENIPVLNIEGEMKSDWVLIDLGDIIVHCMLQETREFYQLERIWNTQ